MEQRNESLRDRLLARLPQPENLAAYRDETASLLAKHEKALSTMKWSGRMLSLCAVGVFLFSEPIWGIKFDSYQTHWLWAVAALFFFIATVDGLNTCIYGNQVSMMKEIKQVQLQVLELQASLQKAKDK